MMPPEMTATKAPIIIRISSEVPVLMVTSMNCLQSQIISRPNATRPIPATMRTSILSRIPRVFCQNQAKYFFILENQSDLFPVGHDLRDVAEGLRFLHIIFLTDGISQLFRGKVV